MAYIGHNASKIEVSPQFSNYSKVVIHVDDDTDIVVGDNTGRTLEIDNPFGTQEMAAAILQRLTGYEYQPYTASDALLDPSAEIGDALEAVTVYGGIYSRDRAFGKLMKANVSAPTDEEINHEYKCESPEERQYKRQTADIKASLLLNSNMIQAEVQRASAEEGVLASRITQTADAITAEVSRATASEGSLSSRVTINANSITAEVNRATTAESGITSTMNTRFTQTESAITAEVNARTAGDTALSNNFSSQLSVQATQIAAKVSAKGGTNSTFGWVLNENSHTWYSGSRAVMQVTASGLSIKGKVDATSGTIGGFDIGASALQYNNLNFGDTDKNYGVYIGRSGIQLGKNFSVDNSGKVKASSLTLKGTITFLNSDGSTAGTMSAADLKTGAQRANSGYSNWNSAYNWTDNNGSYCTGGVGNWYTAQTTSSRVSYFKCTTLSAGSVSCSNLFGANLNGCKVQISGGSYSIGRQYDSALGHWVLTAD